MKNAIIIHGMPDKEEYLKEDSFRENQHWLPWLQHRFCIKGILAQVPAMPEPYAPDYEKWKEVFEYFPINEETILVGHSCGGGFLVRWLSENKVNVGQVVLVAPWLDPDKEFTKGFFDFVIDPDLVSRTKGVTVFYSLDDGKEILESVATIKATLPDAVFREFTNAGHFCEEDGYKEFPELLEAIHL